MTEEKNIKLEKIKESLPIFWSSYEHMFDARRTIHQNNINFLLIIVSFLPIICLTLYKYFDNYQLFLIPILFQVLALLVLLKSFFITGQSIPWLELKDTFNKLKEDNFEFEINLIATLKATESDTGTHEKLLKTIINRALYLLILSIFLTVLAGLFKILNGGIFLYIGTAFLLILFVLLCIYYNEKSPFNFDNNYKHYKKVLEELLKD
jgi:hypothetical protein